CSSPPSPPPPAGVGGARSNWAANSLGAKIRSFFCGAIAGQKKLRLSYVRQVKATPWLVLALVTFGCGGDNSVPPSPPPDGGNTDAGSSDGGVDSGIYYYCPDIRPLTAKYCGQSNCHFNDASGSGDLSFRLSFYDTTDAGIAGARVKAPRIK